MSRIPPPNLVRKEESGDRRLAKVYFIVQKFLKGVRGELFLKKFSPSHLTMNKTPTAILFDFNGTLFYDADLHQLAWERFFAVHGFEDPAGEAAKVMRWSGCTGREIMYRYFDKPDAPLSDERAVELATEKESYYRDCCRERPARMHLAKGAPEFLDALKKKGVPNIIATGSEKTNLQFYFERELDIGRWFAFEDVVYDDGSFPGKPAPDIYLLAAKKLGVNPADCVVFEDAPAGMQSARAAGVGMVVAVASAEAGKAFLDEGLADLVIPDFTNAGKILGWA